MSILLSDTVESYLRALGYNIVRSFSPDISLLEILDRSSQQNVFEIIGQVEKRGIETKNRLTPKHYLEGDTSLSERDTVVKLNHGMPIRVKI